MPIKFLKLFTIPDFFALRYSKYNEAIRYPTGILYMVRNATVLGMQLNALAFLFTAFFGTVAVLPILVLPCFVGAGARFAMGEDIAPNLVFYEIIKLGGPFVSTLLLIGALSTIMSCTSTYLFAGGMNLSHDVMVRFLRSRGRTIDDKKEIFYSKIGIAACCGVGILFSLKVQGLIALWSAGLSICASGLIVPFLFAWFNKKSNTESAPAGMIAGGIIAFVWTMLDNPFGLDPIWIGLPVSIVACLIVPMFTPKPSEAEVDATYYFNAKFKERAVDAAREASV